MKITLLRVAHNSEFGTLGILTVGGKQFYTVEQDWENNQPNISCIPNGEYYLQPYDSQRFGKCYIMHNESLGVAKYRTRTSARFGCLMHSANTASQLRGCIAPGLAFGMIDGQLGVTSSRKAMMQIAEVLGRETTRPHTIHITSEFPSFLEGK